MKQILKGLIICCLFSIIPSCKKESAVYGSGNVVQEGKAIGDIDRIEFSCMGDLTVRQEGEHSSLLVIAEDNILPFINVQVKGRTLIITTPQETSFALKPSRPIEFQATVGELNKISLAGKGNIRSKNPISGEYLILNGGGSGNMDFDINVKELEINLSGTSTLILRGIAERQKIRLSEKANYNGTGLDSQKAEARITGNAVAWLKVDEDLEADITGQGFVEYEGSPKVNARIIGGGKVNKRDR